jgi:hypothetical protein
MCGGCISLIDNLTAIYMTPRPVTGIAFIFLYTLYKTRVSSVRFVTIIRQVSISVATNC